MSYIPTLPHGYRWLLQGEKLLGTDECWMDFSERKVRAHRGRPAIEWRKTSNPGQLVDQPNMYRRKLEARV